MKSKIIHPQENASGQSLVEFALSLMLILFILVGAVEISLALFQYVTLRDAAQEGALYGSINPTDTNGIKNRVIAAAADVIAVASDDINVAVNGDSCEGLTSGIPNSLTVTVTIQHQIVMPIAGLFFGGQQINMSANVTDTILTPACH